jgi:hypothetical protein
MCLCSTIIYQLFHYVSSGIAIQNKLTVLNYNSEQSICGSYQQCHPALQAVAEYTIFNNITVPFAQLVIPAEAGIH